MALDNIESNQQKMKDGQYAEIVKFGFGAKMVNHAAVRIAHYISYYNKSCEWPEVEPKQEQIEAIIDNFKKSDPPSDRDSYVNDDKIDSWELSTLALCDLVKKTGKFHILYAYRARRLITAQIDVLFRGIKFEVYFEGKNGQEIWDHETPLACFDDDGESEHVYLDFAMF